MNVSDILVNSLKYPLDNNEDFSIVMILYAIPVVGSIIALIFSVIGSLFGAENFVFIGLAGYGLALIIYFIFFLIVPGYSLSVIREGINQSNIIPAMDLGVNIINTIKLAVLRIVYMIVPIIFTVLAVLVMLFAGMIPSMNTYGVNVISNYAVIILGMRLPLLLIFFVFFAFQVLSLIAEARFAQNYSLSDGIRISEVIEDLREIGITKVLVTYFAICCVECLILILSLSLIIGFTVVGYYAILLVVSPVVLLFRSYALGLLYSEIA